MRRRQSRGRGLILGRRAPMLQLCPSCGRMRVHHPDGLYVCPVPDEVTAALRAFARERGTRWKSILCQMWERSAGSSELLQARNFIGPTRLYKITLD